MNEGGDQNEHVPTLKQVLATYRRLVRLEDPAVVLMALGSYVANLFTDADPFFLLIVGPSSGTKTEALAPVGKARDAFMLSSLTPKTLFSGFAKGDGNKSLIKQLDGRVLILKDFTTVLSLRSDDLKVVLAQLREIFDGQLKAAFGNGEVVDWHGKVGFIAAVTSAIDEHHGAIAQLGTRFLYLRTSIRERRELARAALKRGEDGHAKRADLGRVVSAFLNSFDRVELASIVLSEQAALVLADWADFLALGRTPVIRDRYHRDIVEEPDPEGPTRLVKQLHLAAAAHARIQGRMFIDESDLDLVRRLAWDSIPRTRASVLRAIVERREVSGALLCGLHKCSAKTTVRHVEDLAALGLVAVEEQDDPTGSRRVPTIIRPTARLATITCPQDPPHIVEVEDPDILPPKGSADRIAITEKVEAVPILRTIDGGDSSEPRELLTFHITSARAFKKTPPTISVVCAVDGSPEVGQVGRSYNLANKTTMARFLNLLGAVGLQLDTSGGFSPPALVGRVFRARLERAPSGTWSWVAEVGVDEAEVRP